MLGLSQTELADGIGVTFQQVQKYERGANRVGASRLQRIANILKVEPSFFFEGAPVGTVRTDNAMADGIVTEFLSSKDGLALTKAFMGIKSSRVRRTIVELVERLVQG